MLACIAESVAVPLGGHPALWCIAPDAALELSKRTIDRTPDGVAKAYVRATSVEVFPALNDGGLALVNVPGLILAEASAWAGCLGGVAAGELIEAIDRLLTDPKTRGVALLFDSPGAETAAIAPLLAAVGNWKRRLPVMAYAGYRLQGAAYVLATACTAIFAEPRSGRCGGVCGYEIGEGVAPRACPEAVCEFWGAIQTGRAEAKISSAALEAMFAGESFGAREAHTLGLVDGYGPVSELLEWSAWDTGLGEKSKRSRRGDGKTVVADVRRRCYSARRV